MPNATVSNQTEHQPQPIPRRPSTIAAQENVTPAADQASVAQAIETWREHWQNADTDLYLACYSPSFIPAKGVSQNSWRASRIKNLNRPSMMEITLSDIRITMQGANQATATFHQNYTSDRLRDSVIKTLSLSRESGEWKITKEAVDSSMK